ncbi:hypothetical protein ACLB2K_062985 [Fragaria x ananassa]
MVDSSFGTSCEYISSVSQMHCYLNNPILLDCYARGKDTAGRWAETLLVAYKTLGVVFGGLVTSPLYVYSSILPLKSPTIDEYFGIYSIMFWTLTLIGVVKYATIALRADDDGEASSLSTINYKQYKPTATQFLSSYLETPILSTQPPKILQSSPDSTPIPRNLPYSCSAHAAVSIDRLVLVNSSSEVAPGTPFCLIQEVKTYSSSARWHARNTPPFSLFTIHLRSAR